MIYSLYVYIYIYVAKIIVCVYNIYNIYIYIYTHVLSHILIVASSFSSRRPGLLMLRQLQQLRGFVNRQQPHEMRQVARGHLAAHWPMNAGNMSIYSKCNISIYIYIYILFTQIMLMLGIDIMFEFSVRKHTHIYIYIHVQI